jgi:hypothetical protein
MRGRSPASVLVHRSSLRYARFPEVVQILRVAVLNAILVRNVHFWGVKRTLFDSFRSFGCANCQGRFQRPARERFFCKIWRAFS